MSWFWCTFGDVGFCGGRKAGELELKKVRTSNKLNPHKALGQNWTSAPLVGGECSHHCNISAPQITRLKGNLWLRTILKQTSNHPWWMYGYCSSYLHPCILFLLWWLLVNEDGQTITVGWHLLQVLFYFLFNGCMCRGRQITLGSILSLLFTDLVPDKRNMGGGGAEYLLLTFNGQNVLGSKGKTLISPSHNT